MFPPVAANDSSPHPGPYAGSSILEVYKAFLKETADGAENLKVVCDGRIV
jgi:hypothetical protein